MKTKTEKLEVMHERARQLQHTDGGEALALCLQGLELIRERAESLDVENKWLVVEAVAEVMRMRVEEVSGRLDEEVWVPDPTGEPGLFGQRTVVLAGTVPRRTLSSAPAAPAAPRHGVPLIVPTPTRPDGVNP